MSRWPFEDPKPDPERESHLRRKQNWKHRANGVSRAISEDGARVGSDWPYRKARHEAARRRMERQRRLRVL